MGPAVKTELLPFAQLIEKEIGIVYQDSNLYQLEHRLDSLMKMSGLSSLQDLWQRIEAGLDRELRTKLLDLATNNETSFFRDRHVFDAILQVVLPEVLKMSGQSPLFRIWSAACSTGQEPYTLKMLMEEVIASSGFRGYEIVATDFSERALEKAKSGIYSQLEVQRGLSAPRLVRHFTKEGSDSWKVKDHLKTNLKFEWVNLLQVPFHLGSFDLVLIRNMLIYQNIPNKQAIIGQIEQKIKPRGFLILGAAENLFGISNNFEQVMASGAIVYRKKQS